MIGEKIAEYTGKTTNRRVQPFADHNHTNVRTEVTFEQFGKLFGVEVQDFGTYEATRQDGGTLQGTGQGVSMTKDGETITWSATGTGRFTGKGSQLQWRGSMYFRTESQKLSRVNGQCYVFEYDTDETGTNTQCRVYEWK
jgi:hypothetical protein